MNPALLLIDVQKGIDETSHWGGNRNNPEAEENIQKLLSHWRMKKFPVLIVQHCSVDTRSPFFPGKIGNNFMSFIVPQQHERVFEKSTANAFIGTFLHQHLAKEKITSLVIAGFVTNNSVEATARNAGDFGFKTTVVSDACACFDKVGLDGTVYPSALMHSISLANLKDEYAAISSTIDILKAY
ncbi:cysteine hydrolase family protein [Pseudochryseolinea flava]|uniref:Cysteine hydrolase n=1 Tax=Pseudochryseolinea flava TaxID=2059302 RepID=A0A364Y432_9BACT|nr:cysteine hydrolase family protein [Pseudochryseolinea flava]RAW01710.1 cysteine hydrolase [Pseudochryseolinea flava]